MADYYPLLAKALANLPTRAAPTARRAIYERARKALIGQLRSIRPPVPESDIAVEDAALDQAIARLEAEYGVQSGRTESAPNAPTPARSASSAAPPVPAARPAPTPRPAPLSSPKPFVAPPAATTSLPRAAIAPPAARRPLMGSLSTSSSAARAAPSIEPESTDVGNVASVLVAPQFVADHAPSAEDLAPPISAAPSAAAAFAPARTGVDVARPTAPGHVEAPRRNPWPLIAVALLVCIAGAIAVVAYFWREKPQNVVIAAPTETVDPAAPAGQNKISDRIDSPGSSPTAVETPIPTVTVPVARVPAPAPGSPPPAPLTPPAPAASPTPAPPPTPGPVHTADSTPAPQAPTPAVPGTSRAAILIGTTSDPQKPLVNLGGAVWSIIPATPGQPATLAVRIEVDIPDQKMHATVTIRKNADASLPATHTIDLRATFADGAEIKGVKDMGLPQLRKDDAPTGDAIAGVRVKINDSYYLVGLTRSDADAAHNLELLATRAWFDFPLLLNDDRIAKLTFAKGEAGDRAIAQALDAWK